MKSLSLAALLLLGVSAVSLHAAPTYATGALELDGSNIENGSLFEAIALDNGGTITLNGVTFTNVSTVPASGANFTLTDNTFDGGTGYGTTGSDAVHQLVNEGVVNTSTRFMTLTLTGLSSGDTYSAQLIFDTGDSSGRSASITDNGATSDTVTSNGSEAGAVQGPVYITDTFTAGSTSEVLTINDKTDLGGATPLNLNGFVVDVIPEPNTVALIGVGLLGLVFVQSRLRPLFRS